MFLKINNIKMTCYDSFQGKMFLNLFFVVKSNPSILNYKLCTDQLGGLLGCFSDKAPCLPSKVVFRQRPFSIKGCLPSKSVFKKSLFSIKGSLLSKIVFQQRSSSIKGHVPSKVCSIKVCFIPKIILHQRVFSIKLCLPLKFIFHQPNRNLQLTCWLKYNRSDVGKNGWKTKNLNYGSNVWSY